MPKGKHENHRKKYFTDEERIQAERERNKNYMRMERQLHPMRVRLRNTKTRARQLGVDFNLVESDLVIPQYCPFLNIPLTLGEITSPNTASIDRIDSSAGYTKDNVQVISYLANTMKSNATKEELILFAKNILKFYGEE